MELKEFEMRLVRRVPETLEFGVLYVCFECNVVIHLCACGCGEKVVLPIDPNFWVAQYDGEQISLSPSVGNFQFKCKSHYWIRNNRVIWVHGSIEEMEYYKHKYPEIRKHWLKWIVKKALRWFR